MKAIVTVVGKDRIGIIATKVTINTNAYEEKILQKAPGLKLYSKACPAFVPLIEEGIIDNEIMDLTIKYYLDDFIKENNINTLVLGCTHYPLLKKVIGEYMGDSVSLIDAGVEVAKTLKSYLEREELSAGGDQKAENQYYVSDNIDGFENLGGLFLEKEIVGRVEKIDIERY